MIAIIERTTAGTGIREIERFPTFRKAWDYAEHEMKAHCLQIDPDHQDCADFVAFEGGSADPTVFCIEPVSRFEEVGRSAEVAP